MTTINRNNDAFSEVVFFIGEELGSDAMHLLLDSIHFNAETNHITLFARNAVCESVIQRRLVPRITDILHNHGIEGCVTIISSDCNIPQEEQEFARQVNEILGDDFEYIGYVDNSTSTFVVLKTSLDNSGEKNGIMILEVDIDPGEPPTQYSFSVLEDDMIVKVFRAFCEKYGAKADEQ